MDLEPGDYAEITAAVMRVAAICCKDRVVSVLEGGYGRLARRRTSRNRAASAAAAAAAKAAAAAAATAATASSTAGTTAATGNAAGLSEAAAIAAAEAMAQRDTLDRTSLARVCAAHVGTLAGLTRKCVVALGVVSVARGPVIA